jgi:hypothetical protein
MTQNRLAREPVVVDLVSLAAVRCPCGWARRAFGDVAGAPASVHRVEIEADSRTHYHRVQTEIYYILDHVSNGPAWPSSSRLGSGTGPLDT